MTPDKTAPRLSLRAGKCLPLRESLQPHRAEAQPVQRCHPEAVRSESDSSDGQGEPVANARVYRCGKGAFSGSSYRTSLLDVYSHGRSGR